MRLVVGTLAAIAVIVTAIVIGIGVVQLARSDATDVTDLDVGECFSLGDAVSDDGSIDLVEPFGCDRPHDAQVVAIGDLNPEGDRDYPTDDALFAAVDARCATVDRDVRFGLVPIAPTEATWNGRDGRFVCVALVIGGGTVEGDHAAIDAAPDDE